MAGWAVVVTGSSGMPGGSAVETSEIEDEALVAGPRDADVHAVVRLALVVVEQGVAVVRTPREHGGLVGAADPAPAGREHLDADLVQRLEHGLVRGHGHRRPGARQLHLERRRP